MTSLGLGDIGRFPFVEPPDKRNVAAGVQLLEELGALAGDGDGDGRRGPRLTAVGRRLARLPIDPRLARMILEAERLGCVREVVVIAAALSLQDPRERPAEQQAAGRPAARPVQGREQRLPHLAQPVAPPQGAAARAVQQRLPPDVQARVPQLPAGARVAGLRVPAPAGLQGDGRDRRWRAFRPRRDAPTTPTASTRRCSPACSATSALLEEREKACGLDRRRRAAGRCASTSAPAARGSRSSPAAAWRRKNPQFLMAGELVETSRLWARQNAAIKPEWAEQLGAHLVKRTLLRAALVEEAGRGHGPRAGDAVRRTAGRRPARQLRQGRPGARPGAVHPARARLRRVVRPGTGSTRRT